MFATLEKFYKKKLYLKYVRKDKFGNIVEECDYNYNYERQFTYDSLNNLIYMKNNRGWETWYEYDDNKNVIYEKESNHQHMLENWKTYDSHQNIIYKKIVETFKDKKSADKINEYWTDYNLDNKVIHQKYVDNGVESEVWTIYNVTPKGLRVEKEYSDKTSAYTQYDLDGKRVEDGWPDGKISKYNDAGQTIYEFRPGVGEIYREFENGHRVSCQVIRFEKDGSKTYIDLPQWY